MRTVPDDVVIAVVKKQVTACEKACKSWVIEGFPRTKVQALALEQLGVIPDKMISLKCAEDKSLARLRQKVLEGKA